MRVHHGGKRQRRLPLLRRQGALGIALVAGAGTLFAAMPVSQSFRVTVTLVAPAESGKVQCGTLPEPATGRVKITCATPGSRDTSRYHLAVYRAGEWIGNVDGEMGTGTVTSWRIVHAANREYLEMTVGW